MLSRVASHLFWMGRYLERADSLARYLQIQYFTGLDAPGVNDINFTLASLMNMSGAEFKKDELEEGSTLLYFAFDENSGLSIKSCTDNLSENAKNVRDSISLPVFRSINNLQKGVEHTNREHYKVRGLYEFTSMVMERCNIIRSHINNTLLHNEVWAMIRVGMHLERAIQSNRILLTKMYDINELRTIEDTKTVLLHQYISILDSVEGTDMSKWVFSETPNEDIALKFTLFQQEFNKSVVYNLIQTQYFLNLILNQEQKSKDRVYYEINKFADTFKYTELEEVKKDKIAFLSENLSRLYEVTQDLEETYLSY